MNFYIDTEFHEFEKRPRIMGIRHGKGIPTIELISIGIVCENGNEYYAICKDFDVRAAWKNEWLRHNVLHHISLSMYSRLLPEYENVLSLDYSTLSGFEPLLKQFGKTRTEIAEEVKRFVYTESRIHNPDAIGNWEKVKHEFPVNFYGYFADYDWVAFCWLFGSMMDLPKGFPMYCRDLKQIMDERGLTYEWKIENCPDPEIEHHALEDAKWAKRFHKALLYEQSKAN